MACSIVNRIDRIFPRRIAGTTHFAAKVLGNLFITTNARFEDPLHTQAKS